MYTLVLQQALSAPETAMLSLLVVVLLLVLAWALLKPALVAIIP